MQKAIEDEELARTQGIAKNLKDIVDMETVLIGNVERDDKILVAVKEGLEKVKHDVDEGVNQLIEVSCWSHSRYCDLSRYTMLVLTFCMWIRQSRPLLHAIRQLCTPSFVLWF